MNVLGKTCTYFLNNAGHGPIFSNVVIRTVTAYKSALSLENLYPNSSLKLTTPAKSAGNPNEKFDGFIPIEELDITYSRSSGPGGQNVNKVNTKVDIRFHVESVKWLSDDIKTKLAEKMKTKLTKEGFLIYRSDLTRSQQLNLGDCLEKIRSSVRSCMEEPAQPTPLTEERIRKRFERASRERLVIKRYRGQVKSERQDPSI